jgi:hypothetical protein
MKAKKMMLTGLVLAAVLGIVSSCHKENAMSNPANPFAADSLALFSANVAGVNWQTDSITAFLVNNYPSGAKIMTITGYSANRVISISLKDSSMVQANDSTMNVQTYTVTNHRSTAAFAYNNNWILAGRNSGWQQEGVADSGQAVVTASDGVGKTISGTFGFTARVLSADSTGISVDTVSVVSGVFKDVPYTYFRH